MPVRRFFAILLISACLVIAACVPSPAAMTEIPLTSLIQATDPIPTFSPQTTARPSSTAAMLPTNTTRPTNTVSSTATPAAPDIVLPGWVPEGARARMGRGKINQIAVLHDGKQIAVAADTGLYLFDPAGLKEIWSVATSKSVDYVSYSSKENILSTISLNFQETFPGFSLEVTEVHRWDASTGRFQNAIPVRGYGENGIAVAFSPDESALALSPSEGLVDVWDLTSGKLIRTLSDQDLLRIDSLAFSADESILIAAFYGRVVAWDFGSGEVFWRKNLTEKQTGPIALSPDVSLIAVGAESAVEVWDRMSGVRLFDLDAPNRNVTALSFSPDGTLLAAGDAMGEIFQWDAKTGYCLRTYTGSGGAIHTVTFPNKGGNLLAGAAGGIQSWNTVSGERTLFLEDPFSRWEKTRFIPEEGEIAAQVTGKVSLFDAAELKLRRTFEYPEDAVLSPDFSRYVRLTKDAKISVANLESSATLFTWDTPEYMSYINIYSFFLSPDNRTAASIHNDYISPKAADFWSLADGRLLRSVEYASYGSIESTYLEFSPSGGLALLGIWDWEYGMAVKVFDLDHDKSMGIFGSRGKYIVTVSEDDRMIATHCELKLGICLFDLANTSGEEIANFSILDEYETVVGFSPDGKLMAVGSENGLISIWEIADERLLLSSKGHNGAAINLSFSRDGRTLASTGEDGTVILWDLE